MELMAKTETVTTFDGNTIPRSRARRIKEKFYEVGKTCFRVKNKDGSFSWHRINNGKISKNAETGQYERIDALNEKGLARGIADESGEIIYLLPDRFTNVMLKENIGDYHSSAVRCRDSALADKLGYLENYSDGYFYNKHNLTPELITDFREKRTVNYGKTLSHNADVNSNDFLIAVDNFKERSLNIRPDGMAEEISKLIGNLSLGIEFESSKGYIPARLLASLGLIPLRDGSIGGHEYSTVPLEGAVGIQTIRDACKTLSERCTLDHKCSLHVHIGGINRTYSTLIALYETCRAIQDRLFGIIPPFKKDPVARAGLEKDYCKKLDNLGIDFNNVVVEEQVSQDLAKAEFDKIFVFLSGLHMDNKWNLDTYRHPMGQQKWTIASRYRCVNLNPTVFSRSHTVEFRTHHGTFNFTKVINWIMICSAIINFVNKNTEAIIHGTLKPTMTNILNGYSCNFDYTSEKENPFGAKVSEYLLEYMKSRKKTFDTYEQLNQWIPESEYKNDAKFQFVYGVDGFTLNF